MVKPRETTWNDVKTELLQFDRTGLLGLLKDLYVLRPENRAFLAARFGIGSDPLTPFKKVISRWIYPNLIKGQTVSVAKAKKAIADYRKAVGRAEGITELCVFYCEEAARLVGDCGLEDEAYYAALVRMFEQGLTRAIELPTEERNKMLKRLDAVRGSMRGIGWGVSDAVNEVWHDRGVEVASIDARVPQTPGHCAISRRRVGRARRDHAGGSCEDHRRRLS